MGFWGIEVKPGKPHPYHSDNVQGTLYVTQATLGLGSSSEKSILQCSVGHKSPIFLCSLLPDKFESCSLNLEFKDELVAFSVIGPRSIHLSGYFASNEGDYLRDEYESDSGEDIADTESDESSEFDYDDEYEDDDDFIEEDDGYDFGRIPPSSGPNTGVVIEEITEDDKPTDGNGLSKQSKKNLTSDHEELNNLQQTSGQIVPKRAAGVSVLESEDEDGFPISASQKNEGTTVQTQAEKVVQNDKKKTKKTKKEAREDVDVLDKKRKFRSVDPSDRPEKKKKKKKQKEKGKELNVSVVNEDTETMDVTEIEVQPKGEKKQDSPDTNGQRVLDIDDVPGEKPSDKKGKKKKKKEKTQDNADGMSKNQAVSNLGSTLESEGKQSAKSSKARTFANGLVIEELTIGKPDGKRASPGSKVSVHYIGKLKANGKIFDSNVGRAPFKFRLGLGEVIKGWDVGINGMRVGDKRRLTIPPSMGYGEKGAGKVIPKNAWLVFDVELVNVN